MDSYEIIELKQFEEELKKEFKKIDTVHHNSFFISNKLNYEIKEIERNKNKIIIQSIKKIKKLNKYYLKLLKNKYIYYS